GLVWPAGSLLRHGAERLAGVRTRGVHGTTGTTVLASVRVRDPRAGRNRRRGDRGGRCGAAARSAEGTDCGAGGMNEAAYDTIGRGYAEVRQPDPRIASRIGAALSDSETVINVGAGTGSYEPADRKVTAVEPSAEMISQRPARAAPGGQATPGGAPVGDHR